VGEERGEREGGQRVGRGGEERVGRGGQRGWGGGPGRAGREGQGRVEREGPGPRAGGGEVSSPALGGLRCGALIPVMHASAQHKILYMCLPYERIPKC
jgi:hypothetical protein